MRWENNIRIDRKEVGCRSDWLRIACSYIITASDTEGLASIRGGWLFVLQEGGKLGQTAIKHLHINLNELRFHFSEDVARNSMKPLKQR
jgi:hypothetical protein